MQRTTILSKSNLGTTSVVSITDPIDHNSGRGKNKNKNTKQRVFMKGSVYEIMKYSNISFHIIKGFMVMIHWNPGWLGSGFKIIVIHNLVEPVNPAHYYAL